MNEGQLALPWRSLCSPIAHHFLPHLDECVHFFSFSLCFTGHFSLSFGSRFSLLLHRVLGTRLLLSDWSHGWNRFWSCYSARWGLFLNLLATLLLCKEFGWIKLMLLFLFLLLEVGLGRNDVRVQRVFSVVLYNVLFIWWVHIPGLVAIVWVKSRVWSLVQISLQLNLILFDLLVFLLFFASLNSRFLWILWWVFINVKWTHFSFSVLQVRLRISDIFV